MYKLTGARYSLGKLMPVLSLLVATSAAHGASVVQWTGSSSSTMWATSSNFSTLYGNLTAIGGNGQPLNTVTSISDITTQTLSSAGFAIISNATQSLTTSQTTALVDWVKGGGILLLFANPEGGAQAASTGNAILSALGTTAGGQLNYNGATYAAGYYGAASGPLAGTDPAVAGITGSNLAWVQANGVSGGTALSTGYGGYYDLANYLRVGNFVNGKVYVFGEQFGANWNVNGYQQGSNLQFFVNLLAQGTTIPTYNEPLIDNPEPASIGLTALGLLGGVWMLRRRK